jgi:hypothetical protein
MNMKMAALTGMFVGGALTFAGAAALETGSDASSAIGRISARVIAGGNASAAAGQRALPAANGLVKYKVRKMEHSDAVLDGIARALGRQKDEQFGYYPAKGAYYFHDNGKIHAPLKATSPSDLEALKRKSALVLTSLLGKTAKEFVFANTESDWTKTEEDTSTHLVRQTYRYVRKLDGRVIADNTAFARISFAADADLVGFEFANPTFEAMPVIRWAKPSALPVRLEKFAEAKKTAVKGSGGLEVKVDRIRAEKVTQTYYATEDGENRILVPYTSIHSRFQLANGDSFEKPIHFSEDADYADDLTGDWVESAP